MCDCKEKVNRIVAERKAAGNTKEACNKARTDFTVLKDAWWNDCANRLQRAAEAGDTKWFTNCSGKSVVPLGGRPWWW